jgi:hypothetical protein
MGMNRILHTRLDDRYPNERRALEIFDILKGQGKSVRQILTSALLALDTDSAVIVPESNNQLAAKIDEQSELLQELLETVRHFDRDGLIAFANQPTTMDNDQEVDAGFVESMRKSLRTGVKR